MNNRMNIKDTLRHVGARSIVFSVIIVLIFVTAASFIGNSFYVTKKDVLQLRGELNAKEFAIEYDRCLLTRVNIVTLVGRSVDNMIRSDADNEEIESYLTEHTENIIAALDPMTTGLYGWINGEYLDGSDWVPDEDYVPTERPWYTQTMESDREITFVEPYLDMQTKTVMMTVANRLSDGQSVVAMDISLDPIQQIVEQVSAAADGSQAFVIDENGVVIAHSDPSQLGRNYLAEPDSLGGAVAHRILVEGQKQFDIAMPEGNYSVYIDRLEGSWYSVSLINADIWYRPLRNTIIAFSIIVTLVIVFLVIVFLRLSAKNLALQTLHTRIDLEEKRGEALKALSETDRMTGLNDRVNGQRKINELLATGRSGMLMELDIDHFKEINDTYGHRTGDLAIHAVADAMRSAFRANDICMRLGGDEFCVFAVDIVSRDMAEAIVHRFFDRLDQMEIPELPVKKINVSVGVALHEGDEATTFDDLYARTDKAMYISKKTAGNHLTFSEA